MANGMERITVDSQRALPTYREILQRAWPIILANAAVPLLGFVDTAVIGHMAGAGELAALAIASLMFNFIYWSFGFLRMGTTGQVARALGANDETLVKQVIIQGAVLALCISLCLLIAQRLMLNGGLTLLAPPSSVASEARQYFSIRIWAAPATLLTYVAMGVFIGQGKSVNILLLQVFLNTSNALLDIYFAAYLEWGVAGIALGTCIAEYATLAMAWLMLYRQVPFMDTGSKPLSFFLGFSAFYVALKQHRDLFIRTLFLLLSFSFFAHVGGQFGADVLAANHVLLQLISFSAFFLDGYAHVLEFYVGKAIGARSPRLFIVSFIRSSWLAQLTAILLALLIFFVGEQFIAWLTDIPEVLTQANAFLLWTAIYVVLAAAAFQLDGLFIGAGYTRALRRASMISSILFVSLWYLFAFRYGNWGLWFAFVAYVCIRAVALLSLLPGLYKSSFRGSSGPSF